MSSCGTFVAVGLLQPKNILSFPLIKLLDGLTLTGALFGNYKGRDGVQMLAQKYINEKRFRDSVNLFVSKKISLNQINEAFDSLKRGDNIIRNVITY